MHYFSLQEIIDTAIKQFGYDISGKEIQSALLNLEDIFANTIDEPIVFLTNKNSDYYINFIKTKILEFYNGNS